MLGQSRPEELTRVTRAVLRARDVLETGPVSPGRATGRSGRLSGAGAQPSGTGQQLPEGDGPPPDGGDPPSGATGPPSGGSEPLSPDAPPSGAGQPVEGPDASGGTTPAAPATGAAAATGSGEAAAAPDGPAGPAPSEVAAEDPPPGEAADALELVRRAQSGDAEAFAELYDLHVGMVYRYLTYRVGSVQLAEDLTSETFLRALRRLGTWRWQGRDVGAWFVTIARNLVADHYKSSRYRLEITTDDVGTLGALPVSDGPETVVLDRLQAEVVLDAVRRLGPEQQECISLRFLQGLSVAETAEVMGKTDGAVKALQHRAVRALARLLPEGGA